MYEVETTVTIVAIASLSILLDHVGLQGNNLLRSPPVSPTVYRRSGVVGVAVVVAFYEVIGIILNLKAVSKLCVSSVKLNPGDGASARCSDI